MDNIDEINLRPTCRMVLECVRASGSAYGVTVGHVMDVVGRSLPCVGAHLKALRGLGLIHAEEIATAKRGRPPLAYFPGPGDRVE